MDERVDILSGRGRIHPALHVDAVGVIVGVVSATHEYHLITDQGHVLAPDDVKSVLKFPPRPYPELAGRWPGEDFNEWIVTRAALPFADVAALLLHAFSQALELHQRELKSLLATWTLGTWFAHAFLTFPRLALTGERESGKSKVLALLQQTAWNAFLMVNPTAPVLFRLVHEFRPTLLLDEMEGLTKEDAYGILSILNSGYKQGVGVPRVEGDKVRRVEHFETYAPAALAAIRAMNAVTENRAIPLVMERGADDKRINLEVDPAEPLYGRIRAGAYRLVLGRWAEVRKAATDVSLPTWLKGRARELWKPLLVMAHLADATHELQLTPDLLKLAKEHVVERAGASAEAEALLAELAVRLGADGDSPLASLIIRPGDLREALWDRLKWKRAPSAESVGAWLRRLGFPRRGKDRQGARYPVTLTRLREVTARYGPPTPEEEAP